ncbi:acyl-CoA dehydrogenase family protein [Ralstonia soli]|uniref:Acyl-CoA dehydrogenase n=1 Tax=Ralstonia soli TaxID=2953896 RepID=A0ABT1AG19_9RALS|nr:acyl-CoA dehydrogenase [Ralstonia soli]MCO5397349.1 acyl-CoA dehydrogenase [Ralstonia soli]
MHFSLTEEQQLLESSALAFLAKEYDAQAPMAAPELWQHFADMGWLALPLPEADGGFAGGAVDTGVLMRAFGRHQVNAPYYGCVLLAARLLAELGTADQREPWLAAVMAGEQRIALAHDEPHRHTPWAPRQTCAVRDGDGWRLTGVKALAAGADGADALLVSARLPDTAAHAVFLVSPQSVGLSMHACRTADGGAAADVYLEGVRVSNDARLGTADDATPVLHRVLAEGLIALCWEACGAMQAALEQTVSYTTQREQFGQAIAKFQVVQHRLAEMAVCCEEALAATELAALRVNGGTADVLAAASMAKSKVGRAARYVAQESVQLHGAMGVSEETPVAGLFRRLTAFQQHGGATAWHSAELGRRLLESNAWRESQTLLPGHHHAPASSDSLVTA